MTPPGSSSGYFEIARRRWPLLVAALGIGLVGAALAKDASNATYSAESRVALRPIILDPFQPNVRPSDSIDRETEREQVTSDPVIARAADLLGVDDVDTQAIVQDLVVSAVGDAQVLRIEFSASEAADAQLWAAAITDAYLERRQASAEEVVASMVEVLSAQIGELEAAVPPDELTTARSSSPIADLIQQRVALLSLPTDAGEVIRPASMPTDESGAPPWVGQLGVLALALLAGAGAAVAVDRTDDRLRSIAEVAEVAGPVLGTFRLDDAEDRSWWRRAQDRRTAPDDSPRIVQLRLVRSAGSRLGSVVVTSPHWGPPTSEVAFQIAPELAGDGHEALLVGVGLEPFTTGRPTLLDVFAGTATLDDALRSVRPGLSVLEVGGDAWDEAAERAVESLRRDLRHRFRSVVLVCPPILDREVGGLELSADADAVILVIDDHGTDVGELTMAVEALESVGARLGGTVIARPARAAY